MPFWYGLRMRARCLAAATEDGYARQIEVPLTVREGPHLGVRVSEFGYLEMLDGVFGTRFRFLLVVWDAAYEKVCVWVVDGVT